MFSSQSRGFRRAFHLGLSCLPVLMVLAGFIPFSATAFAKRKPANYGIIRIRTSPGGFSLELDGQAQGLTTLEDRSFNLDPGVHTLVVTLPNGSRWSREIDLEAGRIKCVALDYRPATDAPPAVAKASCPSPLKLMAPPQVNAGEIISFAAIGSHSKASPLIFNWSLSPSTAVIQSGSGTPTIRVDSSDLAAEHVTATLTADNSASGTICRQVLQIATYVLPPPPRENARQFDVCTNCSYDDQKARLDNLAVELQDDPSTVAYILAYRRQASRINEADRLGQRAWNYLVSRRNIERSRIVVLNGGFHEADSVELWIVPRGAAPPRAVSTNQVADFSNPH